MSLVWHCSGAGMCHASESWLVGFISVFIKMVWPVGYSWLSPVVAQVNLLRNNFFQTKPYQYAFACILRKSKPFFFSFLLNFWGERGEWMLKFLSFPERSQMFQNARFFKLLKQVELLSVFHCVSIEMLSSPHYVLSYLVSITSTLLWRRGNAGKPANHSSIRAYSRACGANLCDLHKGPLRGEPFFLPCNGKEKTWQLLWSAKQKQGEQGANGQLCAQNCEVSAGFLCAENSVTALHRRCTHFCMVLGYLWHSFRKTYCSKVRENLGCCQLWWSKGVSTSNLQCEMRELFLIFWGKMFKRREGIAQHLKIILVLRAGFLVYSWHIFFPVKLTASQLLMMFFWFSVDAYDAFQMLSRSNSYFSSQVFWLVQIQK